MAKSIKWPSLDLLRGLAVAFMLVNHAAVKWLSEESLTTGFSGVVNFIGSFAPVLFFFATGLGYGLAHEVGRPAHTKDVFIKALILIVADIFMRGGDFFSFGWDFLAFIAFSMILLHGLRGRVYGIFVAIALIFLLLGIRFVLAPLYEKMTTPEDQVAWLRFALGSTGYSGFSYWFTPWFVYPLIGFVLGAYGRRYTDVVIRHVGRLSLGAIVAGLLCSGLSFVAWTQGANLFRWGMMSLNFFIASIACMLICLGISMLIADALKNERLTRLLSMRGVSSLAVVPIHYFILALLARFFDVTLSSTIYLVIIPFWLTLCFVAGRATNDITGYITRDNPRTLFILFCLLVVCFAVLTTLMQSSEWLFFLVFIPQYILCMLLGFSYSKR